MTDKDLENFIEEYGKDIFSFCAYLTKNKYDAEDLYQQTFLTAFEKAEIDESRRPKSYLIAVAVNIWNNRKRKFAWRNKRASIMSLESQDIEQLGASDDRLYDQIIRKEEIEQVSKLVKELPEKMRVVVLMFYMEEMSLDEIADSLNIPIGTVKSRLHQAKNKLRERMENHERY